MVGELTCTWLGTCVPLGEDVRVLPKRQPCGAPSRQLWVCDTANAQQAHATAASGAILEWAFDFIPLSLCHQ